MSHLALVTLIVREYDPAIEFFVNVLQFELVEDVPSLTNDGRPKRWVVVRPRGSVTGILLARADGERQAALVGEQFAGRVGMFLRVDDFQAAHARLTAAGVRFLGPPRSEPYGQVAVFMDLEGNRWDLLGSHVRRLRPDEWRRYRELRLRALADSPDAFGSTLEAEQAKPDDYWSERLAAATSASQLPLVAEVDKKFIGLAWGWIDPSQSHEAHVFQMWVAPEARGRGIGSLLLDAVVDWARQVQVKSVVLRVTCGNAAANQLYARAGFAPAGDPEPLREGSTLLAQPMSLTF